MDLWGEGMTITVGFWCDECRLKYVRHVCKEGLPCGHDLGQAVFVHCQRFKQGNESVYLRHGYEKEDGEHIFNGWLVRKRKEETDKIVGPHVMRLWFFQMVSYVDESTQDVGDFLRDSEGKVIRALLERWSSCNHVPDWRLYEIWPDYLDLVVIDGGV